MKSDDYRKGYGVGYFHRKSGQWPRYAPPLPPDPIIRHMMQAMLDLRGKVDADYSALFEPSDPIWIEIGPYLEKVDMALSQVSQWLKDHSDGSENAP